MLTRPAAREALVGALEGVDRLVLLGDVLELRQGPAAEALERAAPVLGALGAAMAGREVVLVPGNHDHGLLRPWLDERPALGLHERVAPRDASALAARVAQRLGPARVGLAYPGLWLREDVYATHGHYLDVHSTVPTFERLGAGLMARLAGAPGAHAGPGRYEAILAPIYAGVEAAAQRTGERSRAAGAGRSIGVWRALAGEGRHTLRARAIAAGFPLAVGAINRAGLGPVGRDVSGDGLRRGLLGGMHEAVARLGIGAPHVIFGHTHRAGPLPGDDPAEWRRGATRLHNAGAWVLEADFVAGRGSAAPHWPGGAVEVGESGPPVLRRLLAEVPAARL